MSVNLQQAQDVLVLPLLRNCFTPNDTFFSQSLRSLQYSGLCNSGNCTLPIKVKIRIAQHSAAISATDELLPDKEGVVIGQHLLFETACTSAEHSCISVPLQQEYLSCICTVGFPSERYRQRSVQAKHHQLLGSDERQSDAEHHSVEA